jgi:hypothetical protein
MAMLPRVCLGPLQWFYPMGTTAAVSLAQDLPPGKQANCLLLGNGDLRNILFTLYNEQNCTAVLRNAVLTASIVSCL